MEIVKESRQFRKLNQALFGDPTGIIRTFAIISAENPLGALGSDDEDYLKNFKEYVADDQHLKQLYNRKATSNLKQTLEQKIRQTGDYTLKRGNFTYQPIKGKYGNSENSLMIFNLTKQDQEIIARNYGQESFFFGNVYKDECHIAYYLTTDHCKTYHLVEVSNTVSDETEALDFFSKFGIKFRINLQQFGDAVTPIQNDGEFEESLNEERDFESRAIHRKSQFSFN